MSVRAGMGAVTWLDMTTVSLGMGVNWVCGVSAWTRLQHALVLNGARVGIGQAGLGLGTH